MDSENRKDRVCPGAVIERGRILAGDGDGYTVESYDRPGVKGYALRDANGTARQAGDNVYFFLFPDGTGKILYGME